ncbi:glycosyltransferase involved in cell wall biosynthesis [Pseudonocardia hierapolitana]|uniref:Glycosyltransferase involved in cell wall biosynthesis n=1 Tax=Pseudonocardia hierapolitana TaxID=1128676 RepID=A0A561T257_9PSEU|nr:glycosyltransferase [Pseudonocardia hierapolitana]TWF81196.1 glycosyltransferase involved in cell wall biosynthesis [Pseudonocardia hierapolitana]
MRIAHLVPTLNPNGPEIGLVDLASAAGDAGIELVVIALATTSDTTLVSPLRRLGVPVVELGLARWDPRSVARTAAQLRAHGVQLVHTHLPSADVVGVAAAVRNRIPAVSTLHRIENMPADRADRLKRTTRILARRQFMARTIAISQVQLEWYRGLAGSGRNLVLVPNGVADPGVPDRAARRARRAALDVADHDVLLVSSAPMRRGEGHELLLDAVEALPDKLPLAVALAGDGPLRPWLESRVDRNDDLSGRVRFVHRHQDPAGLLAAADLVVHTPRTGAAPTTLLRAMAAGVPVIATRVGGIPEIVTPAAGVLVPMSAPALVDALVGLTEDDERRARMAAAARARFLAQYDAAGWARRLRGVYDDVLARTAVHP